MRARYPLAALIACTVVAPASAFVGPVVKHGDLDGDGVKETVRAVRVDLPGVDDMFDQTRVRVEDTCKGKAVHRNITGKQDNLVKLRLKRIESRRGSEVFADLRSGAAARQGEGDVVAWRHCKPRRLFRYRSTHPSRKPAGSNGEVADFDVTVRQRARRYPGLEVRLAEGFLRKGEPECCPGIKKVTLWRYSHKRDRYVRYATSVSRKR